MGVGSSVPELIQVKCEISHPSQISRYVIIVGRVKQRAIALINVEVQGEGK